MIYSDTMAFLSSPQDFMFQHHEDLQGGHSPSQMLMRRSMSFSGVTSKCDEDDMSDDGLPLGEKKRRLNVEQVKALEKSFELGNKLQPERKTQLARALGLQPRQVAIWFQNRRARWKTKQLERDYDVLKRKLDCLKADNDNLQEHNRKLQAELVSLKGGESTGGIGKINLNTETDYQGNSWSNGSDQNSNGDVYLGITRTFSTPLLLYPQHQVNNNNNNNNSTSFTHLLQSSSSSRSDLHCDKIDRPAGPDEALCTMFGGVNDQPGFWSWPEQQHFN